MSRWIEPDFVFGFLAGVIVGVTVFAVAVFV